MGYDEFSKLLSEAAEAYKQLGHDEIIRVVTHLDADGLSGAAVVIQMLTRDNRRYSLSTVHQLDETVLKQIALEPYKIVIFADLGAGQFSLIKEHLRDKTVIILDHHELQEEFQAENIIHVNPHITDVNGSVEVSGAGVAYLFAKAVNPQNVNLAHIGIIGAIGDMQEDKGFKHVNNIILQDAKRAGKIKEITGIRVYGAQTRPLHKVLELSNEYPIPGVTGSESAAISFLQSIGIDPKKGGAWKKLVDLTDDELQRLATNVILRRLEDEHPEAILGPVYILREEKNESPLRDAREFATLLNACGRLSKSSLGIGALMGNEKIKQKAIAAMGSYKREISNALRWYRENESQFVQGKGYRIVNAEDNIMPTIIGTLSSIVSKSDQLAPGTFILSMAQMLGDTTKVSLRVAGNVNGLNLRDIMTEIVSEVDGQAGGHHEAAGALFDSSREAEFINAAKRVLQQHAMEEKLA